MKADTGFAGVQAGRLYYEVAGSGRPVVFLHGFTLDARMWDGQFESFAQHHRVLRYDLCGFGRSSTPAGAPYSHAGDLRALLEQLDMAPACLVGLSMGGGVALDFALTYPDAVQALVVVDATLGGHRWAREAKACWGPLPAVAKERGLDAARESWLASALFQHALRHPEAAAQIRRMVAAYSGWHWLYDDPQTSPDPPAARRLQEISAPTLAVVGEFDLPDFHAIAELVEQQVPGARRTVLPGAGHTSTMEDPEGFNAVVLDFLGTT